MIQRLNIPKPKEVLSWKDSSSERYSFILKYLFQTSHRLKSSIWIYDNVDFRKDFFKIGSEVAKCGFKFPVREYEELRTKYILATSIFFLFSSIASTQTRSQCLIAQYFFYKRSKPVLMFSFVLFFSLFLSVSVFFCFF